MDSIEVQSITGNVYCSGCLWLESTDSRQGVALEVGVERRQLLRGGGMAFNQYLDSWRVRGSVFCAVGARRGWP